MSLGHGAVQSVSMKQKSNTRSSTESKLVASDDVVGKILCTKLFLQAQGYEVACELHKDNQSEMKLPKIVRAVPVSIREL